MHSADNRASPQPSHPDSPETTLHVIPTFVATDLLEKLIADRDARAVDRVVTAARRH